MPFLVKSYQILLLIFSIFILIKFSSCQKKNITDENKRENIFKRKLDFKSDSLKICKRSSNDLQKYFETGDTKYVKLYNYKEKEHVPDYILSLIKYLIKEGDYDKNLKNYAKHHIISCIFVVVALACIPGWITCWICKCKKCSPFSCCQKPKFQLPFFLVVSISDIAIIITSIEGLARSDLIFKHISSAECSILRFIDETLEGETKKILPKWGGIYGIIGKLDDTIDKLHEMTTENVVSNTEDNKNDFISAKTAYEGKLETACNKVYGEDSYNYNSYLLDIAKKFGKLEDGKYNEGTYAFKWLEATDPNHYVENSHNVLREIIFSPISTNLEEAELEIELIKEGIEELKNAVGQKVVSFSDKIDNMGKLIFLIIFSIIFSFSAFFEILIVFLYISSRKKFINNLKILYFILKILVHIFWNILAFFMIIFFLLGAIFTLIGNLGNDFFVTFSFILSSKNLESDSPIILEEGGTYLDICLNGDGIINDELGIETDLEKLDKLKKFTNGVDNLLEKITSKTINIDYDSTYEELIGEINAKKRENDFEFVEKISSGSLQNINLKESVTNINTQLQACGVKERWSFSCNKEYSNLNEEVCSSSINIDEQMKCYNPLNCNINDLNNRYESDCIDANDLGTLIDKFISAMKNVDNTGNENSVLNQADFVKAEYKIYLIAAKNALNDYTTKFRPLTVIFDNFLGSGSILDLINLNLIVPFWERILRFYYII